MAKEIKGMEILIFARCLCSSCLPEWNKLLEGEIEEFRTCPECTKKFDSFVKYREAQNDKRSL